MRASILIGLAAALAVGGCEPRASGPLRVALIGQAPRVVDATLRPLDADDAVLVGAAAEGLVRLDGAGQIVPGIAERWSVSDDGLSYIFRLGDQTWPDGAKVTANFVVRRLRAAAAAKSRNPLSSVLTGIEEIVANTDEVLEIRLRAPRPNLLHHLARPELGIVRDNAGAGPFRIVRDAHPHLRLERPVPDGEIERQEVVVIEPARAAKGIALFLEGLVDVVLGGTLGDLPVLRAADPAATAVRFDPASGLLGLAVVDSRGPLGRVEARVALSMTVDRDALVAAFAVPGLLPRATLVPTGLSNLAIPAVPGWAPFPLNARRAEARRLLGGTIRVRVAVPDGPGYRLLFAHLRRDWAAIGVDAVRVAMPRSADLRLVDAVAPSRGASWYLERFSCARAPVCDTEADVALQGAREAGDAATRAARHAEADRRLTDAAVFIPLTAPVRWSLASRRATGFRTNAFAVHSLVDLVDVRR